MKSSWCFSFLSILVFGGLSLCCDFESEQTIELKVDEQLIINSSCSKADQQRTTWYFIPFVNNSPQLPKQDYTGYAVGGKLQINRAKKMHNGTFFFGVASDEGTVKYSNNVSVIIKWRGTETSVALFKPSGDDVIRLGSLVKLVCNFQGHPKPEVTWLKDGSEVVPSDNVELNGDILTVKSLTHDDCGSYMCRVDEIYQERPYIVDVPNGRTTVHFLESNTLCPITTEESKDVWIDFRASGGEFLLNGRPAQNTDKIHLFKHNGSVHIEDIEREVKNVDMINARNTDGALVCEINVQYIDAPKLSPPRAYHGAGPLTPTRFVCSAGDANPPANLFQWFKNGQLLNSSDSGSDSGSPSGQPTVTKASSSIILQLPSDYQPPFDDFSCHIGNGVKTLSMVLKFQTVVHKPSENTRIVVKEGEPVVAKCLSDDSDVDLFTIEWNSFGTTEDPNTKSFLGRVNRVNNDNELSLSNATLSDSVKVTCAAFGKYTEIGSFTTSNTVTITVLRRFKLLNPTSWTNNNFVHYLKEKQTSTIRCRAEGPDKDPPLISWTKDGQTELPQGVSRNGSGGGDLVFQDAHRDQNGEYECVAQLRSASSSAKNGGDGPTTLSRTFDVRVVPQVDLEVLRHPVDQKVQVGESVKFNCLPKHMGREGDGEQQPDTKWWFKAAASSRRYQNQTGSSQGRDGSTPLGSTMAPISLESLIEQQQQRNTNSQSSNNDNRSKSKSRIQILNGSTLFIENVEPVDQGFYYCIFNRSANLGTQALKTTNEATLIVIMASPAGQSMRTILIAVTCAVAYILFMLGLTIYCRKRRLASKNKQLAKLAANANANEMQQQQNGGGSGDKLMGTPAAEAKEPLVGGMTNNFGRGPDLVPLQKRSLSVEKLQFPRHELQTTSLLGRGEYGDVFLAVAQGLSMSDTGSVSRSQRSGSSVGAHHQQTASSSSGSPVGNPNEQLVMVKSLLQRDKLLQEKFQNEMEQYAQLRSGVNVARLVGVCTEMEPLYAIFEYTEWGDMKRFLMSTKGHNGLPQTPAVSLSHKLHLAYQALRGLEYFANHKMVHKDVAARNFLLTADLVVKLSCASLSKDVYRTEYYDYHNSLIPLRWMPLEAVYDESFSQMSDAYSFGVTLWEIFSLGVLPYAELSNEQVLKGLTVGELKLEVPPDMCCPPQVAEIMVKCWDECAVKRPSFSQMLAILTSINLQSDSQV